MDLSFLGQEEEKLNKPRDESSSGLELGELSGKKDGLKGTIIVTEEKRPGGELLLCREARRGRSVLRVLPRF